jgi:hypothetical protein
MFKLLGGLKLFAFDGLATAKKEGKVQIPTLKQKPCNFINYKALFNLYAHEHGFQ